MVYKTLLLLMILISSVFSQIKSVSDDVLIKGALTARDDIFSKVLGNYKKNGYPSPAVISSNLNASGTARNAWYYLLLAETNNDKEHQSYCFSQAVSASENDIGTLWVLFLEFHKRNELKFQDLALEQIERTALLSGIEVLPAIKQQLISLAEYESLHGRKDAAQYCINQLPRFDNDSYATEFTSILLPNAQTEAISTFSHFTDDIKFSWKTQVQMAAKITGIVKSILLVSSVFLLLLLLLRFYPKAVHPLTCIFPLSVPYRMRILFTTLILISLSIFGYYLVLVILSILLLRISTEPKYTIAIRFLAAIVLLIPFSEMLSSRFIQIQSENSPFVLYEKALYGQPTPELYGDIKKRSEKAEISDKEKAIYLTSMALIQYKNNNIETAVTLVQQAYKLWPTSDQVLIAAGNIYHGYGDADMALSIFKTAADSFPKSPEIIYNFGQINLEKVGITDGTALITKASQLSPRKVNGFIKRNSHFFGEFEWPMYRKFFLGTVSPKTFWNNFFQFSNTSPDFPQKMWGASFFGIPLQFSSLLVLICYIISSFIAPTIMHTKKNGECVLCGKPICRKCRANDYCNECQSVLQNISNESLVSSLKIKIADSKRLGIIAKAHLFDILFPGTRDVFLKTKSFRRLAMLLPLTLLSYVAILTLSTTSFTLFRSFSNSIQMILTIPFAFYFLVFTVINGRTLIATLIKGSK